MANNTGTFFNINDNDGIPLVGVSTNGKVMINHLYGNCLIGSTSVTGTSSQPLQVTGGVYVSGSVGVGTTNPQSQLHITGQFQTTRANNTATGGGQIYLNGSGGNRIDFGGGGVGVAAPTLTTRSVGTKIVLYPTLSVSNVDYALGIDDGIFWSSIETSSSQFKWYAGTTPIATLTGTGNLGIGTTNPTSKLQVIGDARVGIDTSSGVILTAENGTKYRLIVSNTGVLSTVSVP